MSARLWLTVSAGSRRNELVWGEGGLRVRVAAAAVEGKANRELVSFLAKILELPPSHVVVSKGEGSRHKLLEFEGLNQEELSRRLDRALPPRL